MALESSAARRSTRADVFGFGVSLWEALYGERPYPGRSVAEITAAMIGPVPSPPARPGAPPRYIAAAVRAAIDPDRANRPASMQAMLALLDPARRDRRRRALVVGGVAFAGLAGVAVGVVPRFLRDAPPAPALCDDAGLADTWNDRARQSIRATLAALPGDARSVADRAVTAGDGYAQRWTDGRTDLRDRRAAPARRCGGCLGARRSGSRSSSACTGDEARRSGPARSRVRQATQPELCETDAAQLVARDPRRRWSRAGALEARLGDVAALVAGDREAARRELDAMATRSPWSGAAGDRRARVPRAALPSATKT
jgi:hypothetical protein